MFTNVMVASPSIALPMVMAGRHGSGYYHHIPGIYVSGSLAGWFVFFSLIAVQGVLLNVLPLRHFSRISLFVQSTVLIALLCAIPWVLTIPDALNYMDRRPGWAFFAPPLWFLGFAGEEDGDQVIAGNTERFTQQLAKLAIIGTFGSFLTAIAVYLWSYRRHRVRVLESPDLEGKTARLFNFEDVVTRFISRPQELAVWSFVVKTFARSRQHRLILAAFTALAFAVCSELLIGGILNPRLGNVYAALPRQTAISIPLAFSLFTLCGFRYVFRLPFELKANWIFRLYAPGNKPSFIAAIEKVFLSCGVCAFGSIGSRRGDLVTRRLGRALRRLGLRTRLLDLSGSASFFLPNAPFHVIVPARATNDLTTNDSSVCSGSRCLRVGLQRGR